MAGWRAAILGSFDLLQDLSMAVVFALLLIAVLLAQLAVDLAGPAGQLADGRGHGDLCVLRACGFARCYQLEGCRGTSCPGRPGRDRRTSGGSDGRGQGRREQARCRAGAGGLHHRRHCRHFRRRAHPAGGSIVAAVLFAGLGAMAGAILGETWAGRDADASWRIAKRAFWGRLAGTLGKMIFGAVMIAIVVAAILV